MIFFCEQVELWTKIAQHSARHSIHSSYYSRNFCKVIFRINQDPIQALVFHPLNRYDVVVFNFPEGDTVINKEGYQSESPITRLSEINPIWMRVRKRGHTIRSGGISNCYPTC
jgi:hypothetical protein